MVRQLMERRAAHNAHRGQAFTQHLQKQHWQMAHPSPAQPQSPDAMSCRVHIMTQPVHSKQPAIISTRAKLYKYLSPRGEPRDAG